MRCAPSSALLAGGMYFFAGVIDRSSLAVRAKKRLVEPRRAQRARARCRALVASGLSSKEIARQLDLSTRTVENYRANLMQKIGVRDTTALVRWCLEHGLG